MKKLYISDLDGTLLNNEGVLSDYTIQVINKLSSKQCYFTFATARLLDASAFFLKDLLLQIPIILLNGALVYNTKTKIYEKVEVINKNSVKNIFRCLKKNKITGFMYVYKNNTIYHYYDDLIDNHLNNSLLNKVKKYDREYIKVNKLENLINLNIICFTTSGKYSKLKPLCDILNIDKNLNIEFYQDVYSPSLYYLEISAAKATKGNALLFIKEKYEFTNIISFGDNNNDISMFLASNECYAVNNAKKRLKKIATEIISDNNSDAVAKWLDTNCLLK